MRLVFITPPPAKPAEPGVSAGAAAQIARCSGVDATSIDASIAWHRFALSRERLTAEIENLTAASPERLSALRRAVRQVGQRPAPLQREETYRDRRVYTSAVAHLETALGLATVRYPNLRIGIGNLGSASGQRLESSATLDELARGAGPFDDYFVKELIPALAESGATHVGVSLTFQHQAVATFRLAALLAERLPSVVRVLGGPLVDCWAEVGVAFSGPLFARFHRVIAGGEAAINELVAEAPVPAREGRGPLSVGLGEAPWESYLCPRPSVPVAVGRGCYWRRCTFCPDHLHPRHEPCAPESLKTWLHRVADRFPSGAMLHLTDSALPPPYLELIAEVIRRDRLPLRWHGFVRVVEELARPELAALLAAGGCAMLQLGVESGSPEQLEMMGKGADPELAKRVLRATARAGIRNQIYLLFGLPKERDRERELTLDLVEEVAPSVHAINTALLNLPRRSPMHTHPERFGITAVVPFGDDTDLSLYDDFYCGDSHPRTEARRWLDHRFFKSPAVRRIRANLRTPFAASHLCFLT